MHIPEKRVCDLCRNDLTGAYIVMSFPLDAVDRQALSAQVEAQMPEPFRILRGMFDPTPKSWRFDFCRGCADGFMPMLADLKAQAIKTWLAEQEKRAETPVGENES